MPKPNQDLLVKGILCSLAGTVLVLAQYVARSLAQKNTLFWVSLAGWFVLMMGVSMLIRYAKVLRAKNKPPPAGKSLGIVGSAPTQAPNDNPLP